jgi:hypothetical protein
MKTFASRSLALAIVAGMLGACQPGGTGQGAANGAGLPGKSVADRTLAVDASAMVLLLDSGRSPDCDSRRVANTRFVSGTASDWQEVWTVEACGATSDYRLTFTSSPRGGTDISVSAA